MARLKLIGTNLATALVTAALTSLFWIAAYSGGPAPSPDRSEPVGTRAPAAQDRIVQGRTTQGRPLRHRKVLAIGPTGLALPVLGVKPGELVDTYRQARAAGARRHDAIDIMAPAGTPVVAAAPGVVEKLFFSEGGGGVTAYVRSPDGRWSYYYAHLQAYARGLREGGRIGRGDPIGVVGSSGNASPEAPHLHFAIHRMAPGDSWYEGTPIDPYPLLAG